MSVNTGKRHTHAVNINMCGTLTTKTREEKEALIYYYTTDFAIKFQAHK